MEQGGLDIREQTGATWCCYTHLGRIAVKSKVSVTAHVFLRNTSPLKSEYLYSSPVKWPCFVNSLCNGPCDSKLGGCAGIFECNTGTRFLLPAPNSQSPFCWAGCSSPERKSRGTACIIKYNVSLTQYLINIQLDHAPHRHNIIPLIWISLHLSSLVDNALNASFFHDFLRRNILVRGSV